MSRLSVAEPSLANTRRSRVTRPPPSSLPTKRLILCEDGTWLNSENGSIQGAVSIPSNVTRIARAIKPVGDDGVPQVVYYHYGVGATGTLLNKLSGLGGAGINEIIREGYSFIANNYSPGDEIYIFGFSRGAFTARSIAGLIDKIGILTKAGLPYLAEIFRDVRHAHDRNYVPKHPDIPFRDKMSAADPEYREELQHLKLTRLDVPIKVVGVWETVGSLGVPKLGWLTRLKVQSSTMKDLAFYDTALGNCIEYAFQALALDERRYNFQPTLWEKLESNATRLRQVWFPGAHANVGGSYNDQQIATITLAWMVAQCQPFLTFDLDYVIDQWEECDEFYEKRNEKIRPWSWGKIFDGVTALYAFSGTAVRKPGRYCVVNPDTGQETHDPLQDTCEYIHPCVRARLKLGGPGIDDKGQYDCKSLQPWKLIIENEEGAKGPSIYWKSRDRPEEGFMRDLPEAPLKPLEKEILDYDADTRDYVLRPSGVRRRSKRRSTRSPRPD